MIEKFDSAKIIYELLGKFKNIQTQGVRVIVNWYYHPEDDDLLEEGQIMSEALYLPFNFKILED